MKLVLAIAFTAISTTAHGFDDDCEGISGSSYVEACHLSKSIDIMERELESRYQKLLKRYQGRKHSQDRKSLIEAQRAWRLNRNKVCELEQQEFGGINSISWTRCNARMAEERLSELKALGND